MVHVSFIDRCCQEASTISKAFPSLHAKVYQGIDNRSPKLPTLDNLHKGFYGHQGRGDVSPHVLMDIQCAATEDELARLDDLLTEDVQQLYCEAAPNMHADAPLAEQLQTIASSKKIGFVIGLDAGKRSLHLALCLTEHPLLMCAGSLANLAPALGTEWNPYRTMNEPDDVVQDFMRDGDDLAAAKKRAKNRISLFTIAYETVQGRLKKNDGPRMRCFSTSVPRPRISLFAGDASKLPMHILSVINVEQLQHRTLPNDSAVATLLRLPDVKKYGVGIKGDATRLG